MRRSFFFNRLGIYNSRIQPFDINILDKCIAGHEKKGSHFRDSLYPDSANKMDFSPFISAFSESSPFRNIKLGQISLSDGYLSIQSGHSTKRDLEHELRCLKKDSPFIYAYIANNGELRIPVDQLHLFPSKYFDQKNKEGRKIGEYFDSCRYLNFNCGILNYCQVQHPEQATVKNIHSNLIRLLDINPDRLHSFYYEDCGEGISTYMKIYVNDNESAVNEAKRIAKLVVNTGIFPNDCHEDLDLSFVENDLWMSRSNVSFRVKDKLMEIIDHSWVEGFLMQYLLAQCDAKHTETTAPSL